MKGSGATSIRSTSATTAVHVQSLPVAAAPTTARAKRTIKRLAEDAFTDVPHVRKPRKVVEQAGCGEGRAAGLRRQLEVAVNAADVN